MVSKLAKSLVIGVVAVVLILVALFAWSQSQKQVGIKVIPDEGIAAVGSNSHDVAIKDFAFSSPSLKIKAGDTVVWTNQDSFSHTVLSDSGSEINSGALAEGKSYSKVFSVPGVYSYYCSIHPSMKGTIGVS